MVALSLLIVLFTAPVINGGRRWFGFAEHGRPASELAKPVMILFVADLLARRMRRVNELRPCCCRSASSSARSPP